MPNDDIDVEHNRSGRVTITLTREQLATVTRLAHAGRRRPWEWFRMVVLDAIEAEVTDAASQKAQKRKLVEEILADLRAGESVVVDQPTPTHIAWNGKGRKPNPFEIPPTIPTSGIAETGGV